MSAEELNMDNSFRKAAGEIKISYSKTFWKDAERHLDDSSMDAAFLNAASVSAFIPDMNIADTISDAFMDEAFKSAAQNVHADFSSASWSQFSNERSDIEQNVSFTDAANSVFADYHPVYWTDADQALQNEGLHFEYKSSYWNDAKVLLDKSDRSVFFKRWSAVAAILLLFSVGGVYTSFNNESGDTSGNGNSTSVQPDYSDLTLPDQNSTDNTGKEDVLVDSDNYQIQNSDQSSNYQNTSELNSVAENNIQIESGSSQEVLTENNSTDITQEVNISDLSSENNSSSENSTEQINENITVNQENLTEVVADYNAVSENQDITLSETEINSQQSTENLNDENILVSNSDPQMFSSENAVNSEVNSEINEALVRLPGATYGFNPENISEFSGPEIEITRFRLKPTHTLSIYGNAGVGNKYNAAEFRPTFRTNFGFEYRRSGFGKMRNFEFGATAGFNHVRQRDFGTERRVSVFTLDGGTDKLWYKLQLKDMIYANVSGLISYNISSKHKLNFTAGLDYLVFVQSNMSYKVDSDEGIKTVNNNWGVKDGLNKIDLRVGVGYEFALTKNIALRANGSFGFFDRSENNFMDNTIFDQELNVTAGIKYTFLRKL